MEFKDLKKGSYIKWTADRMFKAWDTFGKVISITKNEATIMTYDDFKETKLHKSGEAISKEISLCSENDVLDYMQLMVAKLNAQKVELEIKIKKEMRLIEERKTKLSECVEKILKT